MPKYQVVGYATCSVVAVVTADNEDAAKKKALELDTPSVFTNNQQDLEDGAWQFNEFDDTPADAVHEIELLEEEKVDAATLDR